MNATGKYLKMIPIEISIWTTEEVCSLLRAEESDGGAGLSDSNVKPLFDSGFDGASLVIIIYDIQSEDKYFASEQLKRSYRESGISLTIELLETIEVVVNWVDKLLETKKLFQFLTVDELEELICGPILSEDEFQAFKNMSGLEFHSKVVHPILKGQYSQIQIQNKSIEIPPKLQSWCENNHFKVTPQYDLLPSWQSENVRLQEIVSRLIQLNVVTSTNNELIFVIEKLVPFIELFEKCVLEYEQRKTSSIADFNFQLRKLGLVNENSHIYIYPNNNLKTNSEEKSLSCEFIGCSFAPTIPQHKYKEREEYLRPNTVLAFIEPPGTGKTHFAFHLTNSNRLVIPLNAKHIKNLYKKLEHVEMSSYDPDSRLELDINTLNFTEFYQKVVIFLLNYSEMFLLSETISSETIKQYILRFLWNVGGDWIGDQDFKNRSVFMTDSNTMPVVWMLDEVQLLCFTPFTLTIPCRDSNSTRGNLLTLIVASLRKFGSVVLNTTYYTSIEDKIESVIAQDSMVGLEKLSHQFKLLPQLNPQEVLSFLNYFISTDNNELWECVSYILQGPIRNTESFLQKLYLKTSSIVDSSINTTPIILEALFSLFEDKMKMKSVLNLDKTPSYKYIFYKLAMSGEFSVDESQNSDNILTFLIRNGVSFKFERASRRFKLISCIEKARVLKYIFDQENWFENCYNTLTQSPISSNKDASLLSEVFVISYLKNHYKTLILPLVKGSYSENYSLKSEYFFEDTDLSNGTDEIRFSSLLLKSLANNVSPCNCIISEYLALLSCGEQQCGLMDILGMLKRNGNENESHPNFIPLTVTLSTCQSPFDTQQGQYSDPQIHIKKVQDFVRTDIFNMYLDDISSKPTGSIQNERYKIESSLKALQQGSRMRVRIMFHPNQLYSNTLKDRIDSGLFGTTPTVTKELTRYSVLLNDNSCIIEICSGIENDFSEWQPFFSDWKKYLF